MIRMMKITTPALLFLLLSTLSSCNSNAQEQNTAQMLKDSVKQKEIFDAILDDSIQMNQFRRYLMERKGEQMGANHQAMMKIMMADTSMCKKMMGNMMDMVRKDTSMCKMMREQMMMSEHMKEMMQNMVQKKGNMTSDGMMCPMHDKMKMDDMKKEEIEHQHN